jgi:hypothetical protein
MGIGWESDVIVGILSLTPGLSAGVLSNLDQIIIVIIKDFIFILVVRGQRMRGDLMSTQSP